MCRQHCWIRWSACFLATLMLAGGSGCSIKNHGSVSYVGEKASPSGAKETQTLVATNEKLAEDLILPDKDTFAIFLRKAYINRFPELTLKKTQKRGEIAIIAKVLEIGPDGDVDYSKQAPTSGRLVYYGDDVRQGQVLNTFFAPVYLPRQYNGGILLLQMYILELDETPPWIKPLLHGIMTAGSVASPESALTLRVLDTIGTSLISSRHDDTIFTFVMTFQPIGAYEKRDHPVLSAGHFALVRDEKRDPAKHLDRNLEVDGRGELVWKGTNKEYLDDTFLVLQVQKGLKAMPANYKDVTFGDYLNAIKEANDLEAKKYSDLVDNLLTQYEAAQHFKRMKNEMRALAAAPTSQTQARTLWATDLVDQTAELVAQDEACKATAKTSAKTDCLYTKQVDLLISKLKLMTGGTVSRDDFKDAAKKEKIKRALIGESKI